MTIKQLADYELEPKPADKVYVEQRDSAKVYREYVLGVSQSLDYKLRLIALDRGISIMSLVNRFITFGIATVAVESSEHPVLIYVEGENGEEGSYVPMQL